jgi:hypothetical protein
MIRGTDERSLISADVHFMMQNVEHAISDNERNEEIIN